MGVRAFCVHQALFLSARPAVAGGGTPGHSSPARPAPLGGALRQLYHPSDSVGGAPCRGDPANPCGCVRGGTPLARRDRPPAILPGRAPPGGTPLTPRGCAPGARSSGGPPAGPACQPSRCARGARPSGGTSLAPCGCAPGAAPPGGPRLPCAISRSAGEASGRPGLRPRSSLPGRKCGGRRGHRGAQRLRVLGSPSSQLRARQLRGVKLSHPEAERAGARWVHSAQGALLRPPFRGPLSARPWGL